MKKRPVWSEDWWSVIIGSFILVLSFFGILAWIPRIKEWLINPLEAFDFMDLALMLLMAMFLFLLTSFAILNMRISSFTSYLVSFFLIFLLSLYQGISL